MNANLMTKKIEMTKAEAKNAGKLNTFEYNTLKQLMQDFPTFEVVIKPKAASKRKNPYKGLDYKHMLAYIKKCNRDDKEQILQDFLVLTAMIEPTAQVDMTKNVKAASYPEVKSWFLKTFPEIQNANTDRNQKIKEILNKVA